MFTSKPIQANNFDLFTRACQEAANLINADERAKEVYSAIPFVNAEENVYYSSVLLCAKRDNLVYAYPLMVEETNPTPLPAKRLSYMGKNYGGVTLPGEAFDIVYEKKVKQKLEKTFDGSEVLILECLLVPAEFDPTNVELLRNLISNVFSALELDFLLKSKEYKGINLREIANGNHAGMYMLDMDFNKDQVDLLDCVGLPVRWDISVSLKLNHRDYNRETSVNKAEPLQIVKVYGYIDFEWVGPGKDENLLKTQVFVPNFVITHMQAPVMLTPDLIALGVACVTTLKDNNAWMQAYVGESSSATDIRLLALSDDPEKDPTKKVYSDKGMVELIRQHTRPGMAISMDVSSKGANASYMAAFLSIGCYDTGKALDHVNEFITELTNGAYKAPRSPMFLSRLRKIHAGYIRNIDANTVKDIRHVSSFLHMATLGHFSDQPDLIDSYQNSLHDMSTPLDIRLQNRYELITQNVGSVVKAKYYYTQLTFGSEFLSTLMDALNECGFCFVVNNLDPQGALPSDTWVADMEGAILDTPRNLRQRFAFNYTAPL